MAQLPTKFPPTNVKALASFDYQNIATGTGIEVYYGGESNGSYLLNDTRFYSEKVYTSAAFAGTGSFVKVIDVDMDLSEFKFPQTVQGKGLVMIPFGFKNNGSNTTIELYSQVVLKKYDGSSETTIATATGKTYSNSPSSGTTAWHYTFNTTILDTTQTNFYRGDILRATVEVWAKRSSTTTTVYLLHSPNGQTTNSWGNSGAASSDILSLEISVPYKIDL